jgi:ligand-binding sensor protein/AraC-like DNA-binding protein
VKDSCQTAKHCGQRLLKIVDQDVLKKIIDSFTNATGLSADIVDVEGNSVFGFTNVTKRCRFCELIWQYQKGYQRCQGAYTRAGKQAAKFGQPYIFRCPAGLVEWAAPLSINGDHLGTIICGRVLMWEPEDFFWIELQEMNKGLGVDLDTLMEAAKELEVISGKKVQAAADLLFVTANHIMKTGWENMRQRQEIAMQQSLLAVEIESRKALVRSPYTHAIHQEDSLEKERELISRVMLGDKDGADRMFQDILVDLYTNGAAKLTVIKARVLELLVVMSRGAVEGGVDYGGILKLNNTFIQEISESKSIDEITLKATRAQERFVQEVLQKSNAKNLQVINQVKRFIRDHFRRNLVLEEIANSVYLSAYYLSHIFKEEQGITVMDYVIQVKMEEAKKLLRNSKYTVNDVAESLGYSDPGYFAKVFKRHESMSPSQYRKLG